MVFWEQKTDQVCYLSIVEETQVLVELIEYNIWEAEYEKTGLLIDRVESWGWQKIEDQKMEKFYLIVCW